MNIPFVHGMAEFTRLRIDRPAQNLTLHFCTNPTRFQVATSVSFTVIAPPASTPSKRLKFSVHGDVDNVPTDIETVENSIRTQLASSLDVDVSRIRDITYIVSVSLLIVPRVNMQEPSSPEVYL